MLSILVFTHYNLAAIDLLPIEPPKEFAFYDLKYVIED